MDRPLLPLSLALGAGAICGPGLSPRMAACLLLLAALLLLFALGASRLTAGLAALLGAALAVGAAAAAVDAAAYESSSLRRLVAQADEDAPPLRLVGVAAADGREAGERWVLLLDVTEIEGRASPYTWGRARIDVGGSAPRPEVRAGDPLAVWAQLRAPRGFANPGGSDVLVSARGDGIHALGYAKSAQLVSVRGPGHGASVRKAAAAARGWARRVFATWLPPGPEEGLVRAMVLGDRSGVDEKTAEDFRAAGTYHVLALSGAQVALLAALLLVTLRRVGVAPPLRAIVASAALVFYAELVGGEVPVVRAAFMAVVVLLGRALDLRADLANLLALAAAVLLVATPAAILDVSFQLSFAATLGLLLLGPPLVTVIPRLPLRAELALAASLAAQAAVSPLLVAHFHRLAPAAIVLNLAAVPLSAAVLLSGLGLLAVAAVAPFLAGVAADLTWIAAHALLRSAEPVRWVPGLDWRAPDAPLLCVLAYVAVVAALASASRRARAWSLALVGAAIFALRVTTGSDGRLHLSVLDVGQGDCLVLRSPHGRVWAVDAGGSFERRFDAGETVVGPYLWSEGVQRIDRLALTHAHPDHVGGAPFLVRSFAVGEVWEGPAPVSDGTYAALDTELRRARVGRRTVTRGAALDWDGVRVEVLGPPPPARPPWRTRNDDSLVLKVTFGSVRLLLTGDIEAGAEAALSCGPVTVVKAPHHGSRTSNTPALLAQASPRIAIVSVGYRSRFGHPHPEVVARYRQAGVVLFRTDRDGTVEVATDGRRTWVRTFREGRFRQLP